MRGKERGNAVMGIKGRDITGFLKRDFLLAFKSSVILALLYLFCIPIIRGVKNLDSIQSAQCLEQSVSLIGIILFVPVTRWEHSLEIKELILSKPWTYAKTVFIRLLSAFFLVSSMVSGFAFMMWLNHCEFPFWRFVSVEILLSCFLGISGLFVSQICQNVVVGYLWALGYFALCKMDVLSEGDTLYLFGLSESAESGGRLWCFLSLSILFLFSLLLLIRIQKR